MSGVGESHECVADVRMQWGIAIPMRDGVQLSATLYLSPAQQKPAPAVFVLTPYIGQFHHRRGVFFASHGYPFLTVDVRGRGNSEGTFEPLRSEGMDGLDIVEWLAGQPFCNGQVAMWGGSYEAFAQWATAAERPEHLRTIVPAASACIAVDFPMRCNVPEPYLIQWLTLVAGRTSQERMFFNNEIFWANKFRAWLESGRPFKELDQVFGLPSAAFQEWVAHPQQDEYWDSYNPAPEQYSRLTIPILTITGICDADQPGALAHYREHMKHAPASSRSQHYLVIGPWDHAGTRTPQSKFLGLEVGPESLVDLQKLHLEWYAWTLQGGSKPAFLRNNVAYYVIGADEWRYADSLEAVTSRFDPLYLSSVGNPTDVFHSGELSRTLPAEGHADCYVYDPSDVRLASLESTIDPESRTDLRLLYAESGTHLVYHSRPLRRDQEISGFFRLSVWLAIDQPDTDFRASIYSVDVDGSGTLLSRDWIRARYRESLRSARLVRTAEPLRYDFERFPFMAWRLKRGSRLRLVIGPVNSIYSQKNYNSGGIVAEETAGDGRPVRVRLFHDPERPSVLQVPLAHPEEIDFA